MCLCVYECHGCVVDVFFCGLLAHHHECRFLTVVVGMAEASCDLARSRSSCPGRENRLAVPLDLSRPPLADSPEGFPDRRGARGPDPPVFHEGSFLILSDWESAEPFSGFTSFEDSDVPPPFRLDGPGRENRPAVPLDLSRPPLADPPEGFPDRRGARGPDPPVFHEGSFLILSDWESAEPFSGFSSFEDSDVPPPFRLDGPVWENRLTVPFGLLGVLLRPPLADPPEGFPDRRGAHGPDPPGFHEDSFLVLSNWESAEPFSGFTSFEDSRVSPPFRLDAGALDNFHHFERPHPSLFPPYPSPEEGSLPLHSSRCRKRARLVVEHPQGYVMRRQTVHVRDETPYQRGHKFLYKQC
ncbi:uncharacterized protein LOC134405004 [Elgaria multicarinata webbii]|uniref:uncharacterized protein LOC134405004 n=1 Tax=Elgaria multicarinata webbii TaxID=159646 RepID=UPI002FCCC913